MRWTWIDQIIEYEPDRRMVAIKNVSRAEEYLHDHFEASPGHPSLAVMPASIIVEGMAQTAGILVSAVNRFREKVILAKVVGAELEADIFPAQVVRFDAVIERIDRLGASTSGQLSRLAYPHATWEPIGSVNLLFSHIDQNLGGREFPKENFVLCKHVRTILRDAGLAHLAPAEG